MQNPALKPEIIEKRKQTLSDRYGDGNYSAACEEISRRQIEGYRAKNPYNNPNQDPVIRAKIAATNRSRYGKEWVTQTDYFKEKSKKTNRERYGHEFVSQSPVVQSKIEATNLEKYGVPHFISLVHPVNTRTISKTNHRWHDLIMSELGIDFQYEVQIGDDKTAYADLGYDNVLIDINPTISHSSDMSYLCLTGKCHANGDDHSDCSPGKLNDYHYARTSGAYKVGQRLLHIWDWTNPTYIIGRLRSMLDLNESCETVAIEIDSMRATVRG